MRRRLRHVPAVEGWTDAPPLAREGDDECLTAARAGCAGESETEQPAREIPTEILLDICRDGPLVKGATLEPALEVIREAGPRGISLGYPEKVNLNWTEDRAPVKDLSRAAPGADTEGRVDTCNGTARPSLRGPSGVFMGRAVNGRRAGRSHLWSGRVLWSGSHQAFERPRANQSGTVSMRPGYPALALGAS